MKKFMKRTFALLAAAMISVGAYASSTADTTEVRAEVPPAGMYRSELTGQWISSTLQAQRPIAVMVDNEKTALPHYGLTEADIVYEMMNSTANGRITRFMAIVKDWGKITQFGSIRSARPTNFMLAAEYNAIVCHDGGPYYINSYVAQPYIDNLSGGFARFSNGKRAEYTEYITYNNYYNPTKKQSYAGLAQRIAAAKYSAAYNSYYTGDHTRFSETEYSLAGRANAINANNVVLPFPHNSSKLSYNSATGTYDYSEYGMAHVDPVHNNARLTFENVLLLNCSWSQLDKNGYMVYNIICTGWDGYYLTNGKAIPITWSKFSDTTRTFYMDKVTGQEITLNPGKTYIGIVPSDVWNQLVIQ
ncbi:MAG: DUF3048 domain-containing protein [Lachnospiraceae bacterium]|nr:DUF3048 domain-containing protein [Lachnospiraceae bacterium]